jgi:isoleucyl-tRNA synthetase
MIAGGLRLSRPAVTGKYVFDANIDIVNLLRDRGYCWAPRISSFLSVLLALETPIIFRNVEQFFIRIDERGAPRSDSVT